MESEQIKQSIHEIRGRKIMLDMDLAKLYEVETRILKQAVRRNMERFPEDFMLTLDQKEIQNLVSQNVIPTINHFGGAMPFAFTEQGIAMLSSVLKSKTAIQINIAIMRAFVMIRAFALSYQELQEKLIALEKKHNQKFTDIDQVLNYLMQKEQQKLQQTTHKQVGYKK